MNKTFLTSWVVAFIVWMLGSFLLHAVALGETYAAMTNMMRPETEQQGLFGFMLLAHVLMAGAFVWIYQRGMEDKPWLTQGLRFGIAIAILKPLSTYMIYYVVQQTPKSLAMTQVIGDSFIVILVAIVVAFLNRKPTSA